MNKKLKALSRMFTALICVFTLCSSTSILYAENSVDFLEKKNSDLKNELDDLNDQLTDLSSEITKLTEDIEKTNASVKKAELDLAAAKLNEELQYDSMKKRIKYMYEAGHSSLLQMICSAETMGEFLNRTEFVQNVTEYDRNMLDELKQAHANTEKKEKALKEEQAQLQNMQKNLNAQKTSLNDAISSATTEFQDSSQALAQAKAAQAAAEKATNNNNTGSTHPSGGSGTIVVPSTPAGTDDLVLFAAILECEAGSTDYNGLLAVATVIMNRVESSRYPNTIHDVVYQKGQFSPTWNGSLNRVLARGPASLCYQVAQDALNGARLAAVKGCYQFRASWTGHAGIVIGGNVFF